MSNYLLAVDQGTTGTTSLLIDAKSLKVVDKEKVDYRQIYPHPAWVEHDLNDIWQSIEDSIEIILKRQKVTKTELVAIGITNQRETTCAFNRQGKPLHNAIVWQDRRTASWCDSHREAYEKKCRSLTGAST